MVGHKFIDNMLAQSKIDQFDLMTFSEESRLAYDRVQLSAYFSGKTAEDLALTDESYYQQHGVKFLLSDKVTDIDCEGHLVTTASGQQVRYDKLVLATGSYPFVPPIPGGDAEHCLVYRTIDDLEAITESSCHSDKGVVIGGGY